MNKANSHKRAWIPAKKEVQRIGSMKDRPVSRAEYHTARWTREAKVWKIMHPLCKRCADKGKIQEAQVVDHIIPVDVCSDFWDNTNWQSLCKLCNIKKGNQDKKRIKLHKENNNV